MVIDHLLGILKAQISCDIQVGLVYASAIPVDSYLNRDSNISSLDSRVDWWGWRDLLGHLVILLIEGLCYPRGSRIMPLNVDYFMI